ncbi:MAG: hypothetical protein IJ223_05605 [Clostridia bacterium]|nr:hypothetical protein [Clostridia bacterium]
MKKNSTLKLIVLIVIVVLIALISFVGIYKLQNGQMVNIMPNYNLGKEFSGTRLFSFIVDDSTKEIKNEETETEEETAETTTVPVNSKEVLTESNYQLVKEILEKRLVNYGIIDYDLRVDKNTGTIALETVESTDLDDLLAFFISQGKFSILDAETNEVLLDNANIKEAKTMYYTNDDGTNVYLDIVFDEEGKAKLEEISKTYVETTDEEGNSTKKNVTIKLDDDTVTTTYFGQTMSTGELPLTIGTATTDANKLRDYLLQAGQIETLINNGMYPIVYTTDINEHISPIVTENILNKIVLGVIIVVALMTLYLIIKYKMSGIIAAISIVGYLALYLIMVRFTDTIMSLEAFAAIAISVIIQFVFVKRATNIVKEKPENAGKEINKEFLKSISIQIPLYIMAIVFVFVEWETIKSFGIALFWGLLVYLAYNYFITKPILMQKANIISANKE